MVYWLGQAQWHVGPVVPAATGLVSTITTHKRRAGLHALAQSYTWGIYLAFTLMFIALFGAWEVYYNRNLNKLFFDLYYPLLDLFCLQCLVVLQLRSSALNTEYSYRLAIHYLLLSLFALLLGDTLYALTTSLPDTHAFAYEQNPNWIDFIFSTAFILRGIALFYAHTQHSG